MSKDPGSDPYFITLSSIVQSEKGKGSSLQNTKGAMLSVAQTSSVYDCMKFLALVSHLASTTDDCK